MPYIDPNILITLFCWGLWGISDKKALSYVGQEDVILRLYVISFFFIPIAYFALNHLQPGWGLSPEVMLWSGLASASYMIAMLAYMSAMSTTEASYVLGITAAYPLIFQIVATIFLGEELLPQRMLGAVIIAFGLFFIGGSGDGSEEKAKEGISSAKEDLRSSRPPGPPTSPMPVSLVDARAGESSDSIAADSDNTVTSQKAKSSISKKTIICLLIATFTWGVYGIFDKKAVGIATPLVIYFAKTLWDVCSFFIVWPIMLRRKKIDWTTKPAWGFAAISEFALAIGAFTYLSALARTTASYVITITGCYPLLMYLFALLLLKEKFNKMRFLGIILVVIGGIVVQLTEPGPKEQEMKKQSHSTMQVSFPQS
jgi:drug/metabolite transporter (DMT)-like permease